MAQCLQETSESTMPAVIKKVLHQHTLVLVPKIEPPHPGGVVCLYFSDAFAFLH